MMKNMMKTMLLSILLMLSMQGVAANQLNIIDNAELFTNDEEINLQHQAEAMGEDIGGEVVIITTNEDYPGIRDNYIEDMYYAQGYEDNGVVLHIDMYHREVWVQVFNDFDDQMNPNDRDELFYLVQDELSAGRYEQAGEIFIENIPGALDGTIRYGLGIEMIGVIVATIIVFLAIYLGVKSSYAKIGPDKPYPFREKANIKLDISKDDFVRDYITKVHSPRKSSSSSGGGASRSSGRSSSSSGGRF